MDAADNDVGGALAPWRRGLHIEGEHDAGERAVLAERLRAELAGAACETLTVVEPRHRVQQSFGACPVGVELGTHVGTDLQQDFIRLVWRGDALPRAGAERGDPLLARRVGPEGRSEERRVGEEGRSRWSPYH